MVRLLLCCLLGAVVMAEGPAWSLAESPTIRVISDDAPIVTARLLDDLVATQSMLQLVTGAQSRVPLRVFGLKDEKALRELAPDRFKRGRIHPFGFSHSGPHAAFIAVSTDRPASATSRTLRHEYAHVLTAALAPETPAWLDEGLAEFWSSLTIDGDRVVAGRVIEAHLEQLRRRKWLPLNVMLKQPHGSMPSNPDDVALFYAQAWAMVHYLLLGQDAGGAIAYVPPIDALPPEFDATVRHYVDEGQLRERAVPWQQPAPTRRSASTISESLALAERASMLVSGEQPRSALPMALRALAIDPEQPLAFEVTGTYYFLNNQPELARGWLLRAFAAGGGSYGAAIYMSLLSASAAERERYLLEAIQARPDSELAWQRWAALLRADGRLNAIRAACQTWMTSRPTWLALAPTFHCGS